MRGEEGKVSSVAIRGRRKVRKGPGEKSEALKVSGKGRWERELRGKERERAWRREEGV